MYATVKNLEKLVRNLSEKDQQDEFARRWSELTDEEQKLAREILEEFRRLHEERRVFFEDQARKWVNDLPPEKQAVMRKMPALEMNSE
jgi:hypothetical protein